MTDKADIIIVGVTPGKLPPGFQVAENKFESVGAEQAFDPEPKK